MRSARAPHAVAVFASIALVFVTCGRSSQKRARAVTPTVAGLSDRALDARGRGRVLLSELGCVLCHSPSTAESARFDSRRGPNLEGAGNRLHADYLRRFLADPSGVDPGTTMPSPLEDLGEAERATAADALADYVRSFAQSTVESHTAESAAAEDVARGKGLFHEIGCVACHAPRDEQGHELALRDSLPLPDLAAKYLPGALRTFLLDPESVRPDSRMPNLHLTPAEGYALTSYLQKGVVSATTDPKAIDPQKVAHGRTLFAERGCAACHALDDAARPPPRTHKPLRDLAGSTDGCLSEDDGPWPTYGLSKKQRDDIAAALSSLGSPTTEGQRIHELLASRNCTACHTRDESGGIQSDRSQYFTTSDESVGVQSRIPPTLTQVGAKLQHDWLIDAIAHGQSVRPYSNTRMPGFGVAFASDLGERLARVDSLPPLTLPEYTGDEQKREATRNLGCDLVGEKGMNCILCHTFAGERVGSIGALDLIDSTGERLRREWFHQYLRTPTRFSPGTLMPEFFPGGVSSRPTLGDGEATAQIDAMWTYLAEGRNARRPAGMRHPPIELVVRDETVMLRRSAQNTGKRAIAVGYPGGVNLTFDAESLGMNQIWWGKFLDASSVWYGQGSGETRPLGDALVQLPKGPAFATLKSADAPWPAASRRELGDRWLGYDLDAQQRPTFRYVCDGITIEDTPLPEARTEKAALENGDARPIVRRTFRFIAASNDQDTKLSFLAARDARIDEIGAGDIAVGESLRIGLPPGTYRIRTTHAARELIVTIALENGHGEQVVDYRWSGKGH